MSPQIHYSQIPECIFQVDAYRGYLILLHEKGQSYLVNGSSLWHYPEEAFPFVEIARNWIRRRHNISDVEEEYGNRFHIYPCQDVRDEILKQMRRPETYLYMQLILPPSMEPPDIPRKGGRR